MRTIAFDLGLTLLISAVAALGLPASALYGVELRAPVSPTALPRQLRVDLTWTAPEPALMYEVQRASKPEGPFLSISNPLPQLTIFSDYLGETNQPVFYRIRSVRGTNENEEHSAWSNVLKSRPLPFDAEKLLTEVQEAGFRYFYDFGHPVSGLARVSVVKGPDLCEIGGTGWGLFNLGVGVERGFITRSQGLERALKIMRFLSTRGDSFHGCFPHWMNGTTGKVIPFSTYDDGADVVETAFLIEGCLFLREYFNDLAAGETELRKLCNDLWRRVEWDWFASQKNDRACLLWHWSPQYGWKKDHAIAGFNECQIAYILALASPTHPVPAKVYSQGWLTETYGTPRTNFGIVMQLGRDLGPPLFWTAYSYMGMDPREIRYQGRTYFDHFRDFCRVQVSYAESRRNEFEGHGPLWGLTASRGPKGYKAFAPGPRDNGTIAPTAALSAMPYLPEASRAFMAELYQKHGKELWGPFGFYDAFNLSLKWVAVDYLGNDVGPIAPMIENYRTSLCWKTFMKAPELSPVLKLLASPHGSNLESRPIPLPQDSDHSTISDRF